MKILQTNFHRGWGGQPSRILMMSRVLLERGYRVTLAVPDGSILAARARAAGLAVFDRLEFRKPKFFLRTLRDVTALAKHLRDNRYDVIDAHGSQDLWTCALARRLAGRMAPLVFTRHNTKRVRDHLFNRWLYAREVDHLIVVSRSVLERYEPFFRMGVLAPERISVVQSAYRPDRFHRGVSGSRVRAELGFAPDVPLVGVVGRLVLDKGQDDLLRAVPKILKTRPEARFLLVGTGSRERDLKDLAASLGVAHAVRFLGFRDDVPEITAALNVSVLPSIDCDASSAVLKEALACGVPAVATSIGGAAEILEDGKTGLLVPPRDPARLAAAILALLDDKEGAHAMGRRGSQVVASRFTPDRLADETIEVYKRVIGRFQGERTMKSARTSVPHAVIALLALFGLMAARPAVSLPATADIDRVLGTTGAWNDKEQVYKVSFPRSDVAVGVDGFALPPFMGLTSWIAFKAAGGGKTMMMGDLVLFQDEVNPAMDAILARGAEVTALHNHFFYDDPRVFFMHVGGTGAAGELAGAVRAAQDTVRKVRQARPAPPATP